MEEGSNVTLCYVSRHAQSKVSCKLNGKLILGEQLDPHVSVLTLRNVSFVSKTGSNFFCEKDRNGTQPGLVIFVASKHAPSPCPLPAS